MQARFGFGGVAAPGAGAHRAGNETMSGAGVELTREELASIRAPIERALTLPARAFTSRAFFDLEVERIFHRRWMALAFEGTLPQPGDRRRRR